MTLQSRSDFVLNGYACVISDRGHGTLARRPKLDALLEFQREGMRTTEQGCLACLSCDPARRMSRSESGC